MEGEGLGRRDDLCRGRGVVRTEEEADELTFGVHAARSDSLESRSRRHLCQLTNAGELQRLGCVLAVVEVEGHIVQVRRAGASETSLFRRLVVGRADLIPQEGELLIGLDGGQDGSGIGYGERLNGHLPALAGDGRFLCAADVVLGGSVVGVGGEVHRTRRSHTDALELAGGRIVGKDAEVLSFKCCHCCDVLVVSN